MLKMGINIEEDLHLPEIEQKQGKGYLKNLSPVEIAEIEGPIYWQAYRKKVFYVGGKVVNKCSEGAMRRNGCILVSGNVDPESGLMMDVRGINFLQIQKYRTIEKLVTQKGKESSDGC